MSGPVRDRAEMIAQMAPVLDPETYHFCISPPELTPRALALFREAEGLSMILPDAVAKAAKLSCDLPMRRITLSVHSALDGVGLTAAVATALAQAGIACNMVAGYHHDHAFVPANDAARAMSVLLELVKEEGT